MTFEPEHDKTNKMACVTGEVSGQSEYQLSLTSLHCPSEKGLGPNYAYCDHTVQMPRLIWVFAHRAQKVILSVAQSFWLEMFLFYIFNIYNARRFKHKRSFIFFHAKCILGDLISSI